MEWRLCWSFHGISMFMHSCLCAMCFHAWRCICMVYLHVCLNSIYGFKKRRPRGLLLPGLIGKLIMSLWVGYHCVCMFVKDPWLISTGSVWPWESCPPHHPALIHHWLEDRVSLSWREIGSQESEPKKYHIESSPNKTIQHVCGNEELCFCVRLICQWPPPTSLLTWLILSPLLMFGCFLLFLPPCTHAVLLEAIRKTKRDPTPSLPC